MHYITLLRHGESEGNISGLLQGQSDYPLSSAGIEQAKRLALFWKANHVRFDLIISSPLVRASQTAEILSTSLRVPVEFDPAWMERNYGHLQGSILDELQQQIPPVDFFDTYDAIGGNGESQLELYTRACLAMEKIIRKPAGAYLVVAHGGILNMALYLILSITPQGHYNSPIFYFGNTGYAQFRYNSTTHQFMVISLNSQFVDDKSEGLKAWNHD